MNTSLDVNELDVEKHEEQDLENGPTYPPQNDPANIQIENATDKKKQ